MTLPPPLLAAPSYAPKELTYLHDIERNKRRFLPRLRVDEPIRRRIVARCHRNCRGQTARRQCRKALRAIAFVRRRPVLRGQALQQELRLDIRGVCRAARERDLPRAARYRDRNGIAGEETGGRGERGRSRRIDLQELAGQAVVGVDGRGVIRFAVDRVLFGDRQRVVAPVGDLRGRHVLERRRSAGEVTANAGLRGSVGDRAFDLHAQHGAGVGLGVNVGSDFAANVLQFAA